MVERPIKKSERQSQESTDKISEKSDSMPAVKSDAKRSKPSDHRSSGTNKKASFKDENKQQINPALARGPKPVKIQANVQTEPEIESKSIPEESQD
ncbi:MAG: hypothetical protein ACR9NN_02335 [Nostochopsis sp.]